MCALTLVGEVVKIELEGVVVAALGRGDEGAEEGLHAGISAELLHLLNAGPRDRHGDEVPLSGVGSHMVLHTIEVGERDVDRLPLVAAFRLTINSIIHSFRWSLTHEVKTKTKRR